MCKLRIENSYRIIPCYTADVSGVCSALFELGGMVVMHDPSGCNSTYNTHDETRWYDHDSLIYITALTEQDAIMGNDKKAVRDIIDAAHRLSPRFIALCGSPIPYLNGTDYKALARMIEGETGITSFAVETNGMHDYVQGAGAALLEYAKHVLKPQWDELLMPNGTDLTFSDAQSPAACAKESSADLNTSKDRARTNEAYTAADTPSKSAVYTPKASITVNVLGATPLDFAAPGTLDSIKAVLTARGFKVLSVFTMPGTDGIDTLSDAVKADVNLVISSAGYKLAQYMFDEYGIPYVTGMPVGAFTDKLCEKIKAPSSDNASSLAYTCRLHDYALSAAMKSSSVKAKTAAFDTEPDTFALSKAPELAIIGEPVTSGSIAAAITAEYGIAVSVLCPLESCEPFLTAIDHRFKGEKQCTRLMQQYKHIIADPLYIPICPDGVKLHRLPHAAFSGRCCQAEMKNLVTLLDKD